MIAATRSNYGRNCTRMRQGFASLPLIHQQSIYLTLVEQMPADVVALRLDLDLDLVEELAATARTRLYEAVAA